MAADWQPETGFTWDNTGCQVDCSWFGFKIAVRPDVPFSRTELAQELDCHQIGNRMLFGGNLLRQPAFVQLRHDRPEALRVVGEMLGSDEIMNSSFFLGTYPGLTQEMLWLNRKSKSLLTFCLFKRSHQALEVQWPLPLDDMNVAQFLLLPPIDQ